MKRLLQSAFSFFRQGFGISPLSVSASRRGACNRIIVSGYCKPQPGGRRPGRSAGLSRRQVGILYADIAAYSRLSEQDEEGTHRRLVESMKIMEEYITARNGWLVHTAGDAVLAEFEDADSALQCAVNVQLAARKLNARFQVDQRVQFRIGVNFGDVIADNGEIYGNAVNLAARLEKLADRGGICVSESVRAQLQGNSTFNFIAMGKQYVKNFSEPVQAFWIEIDADRVVDVDFTRSLKLPAMAS